ncbi:hypothetical protein GobsT_51400 [Gemmata obscuriglobus]|uniref:Uncharacterized protein n=1 Tax=Gemmata obscuriglobus TaxID=114 RepID=A0A2Z3GUL8_9BACT|nr:hypothetical protein [Gemmata obscuriglobus]AWM36978.1 hypothetical protein C1280_08060 [Gemmata obscuriglobus]QEG30335.1 hypothetical protein GobsT_51400 [Gemmata obscuriglobus]VTS09659.1 unnamed protein product [Gemmata obscuriglobus UQM 2246]
MNRLTQFGAIASIIALTAALPFVGADQRPKPAAVDVTRPASAAARLNQALKALYESVDRKQPRPEEVGELARTLNENLKQVDALGAEISKLGPGVADHELKERALRYRALAWLHGWATFARLAETAAKAEQPAGRHTEALIAIGNKERSALELLLGIYLRIAVAERQPDPLRRRLADSTGFVVDLGFRKPWGTDKRPDYMAAEHADFIPATADILGRPGDAPEPDARGLLSVWRLVNLQLDTWRGNGPAGAGPDLAPVAEWLSRLSFKISFDFDPDKPGPRPAEGPQWLPVSRSLERLSLFAKVRTALRDPKVLEKVTEAFRSARADGKGYQERLPAGKAEKEAIEVIDWLKEAVGPPDAGKDDETLPAAAIWLRYVFLYSYRGEGALVLTDDAAPNGLAKYWETCKLPGCFADDPTAGKTASAAPVRWNHAPAAGHFDRAVLDAVRGANGYLRWEAKLPKLEQQRFKVLAGDDPKGFVADLTTHLKEIDALDRGHLAAHVPPRTAFWVASRESAPLLGDLPIRLDWGRQASAAERKRLGDDLAAVAGQVRGMADLQRAIRDAYQAGPVDGPPALRGLATHLGGAEWDLTAMPEKSFAAYKKDVTDALGDLRKALADAQHEDDLRDRYAVRRDKADVRELEHASARLGVEIAAKGREMAALLARAAELEVEVARLAVEANDLLKKAQGGDAAAAGKRLELARRTCDLAAAQVDALLAAQTKATEIVEQAVKDLDALRPKLEHIAQKIEDSKKTSFLSILKAIVKVVTVVLAPFTGGASLAIGTAVDQALTIAEKLGQINWDNPLQALGQLGEVVDDVARLGDLTIGKWGSADMKKGWGDVKGWVADRRADVTKLGEDGKKFLDQLKTLAPAEFRKVVAPLVAAVHLDLPVEFDPVRGTIKVDLGKAGIKLKNDALAAALKDVLESGGTVVADIKARVEKWGRLSGFDDATLKTELPKAIDELVAVLPADLQKDAARAKAAVDTAKAKLKDAAGAAGAAGEGARRLLAQVLTGNLVVVLDANGAVTAVERATAKEIARTRARIEAYKAKVEELAIGAMVDSIKKKSAALLAAINAAQDAKDENQLRDIARGPNGVTATVASVRDTLVEFEGKIKDAKGELQDAETKLDIDTLLKDSADVRVKWAEKLGEKDALHKEVAELRKRAADLAREIADLTAEAKALDLEAATMRRDASRAAVQRTYSDCLRWGVNPQVEKGEKFEPSPLSGVSGVLGVRTAAARPGEQSPNPDALRRAATGVVGMLRWVRLVGQAGVGNGRVNDKVTTHYTTAVSLLTGTDAAPKVEEKLLAVVVALDEIVAKAGTTLPDPYWVRGHYPAAGAKPPGPQVEWLTTPMRNGDRELALADVPPEYRARVLGRMRLLAAPTPPPGAAGYGGYELTADPTKSYYVFPAHAQVICPKDRFEVISQLGDYWLLIVPPDLGRLYGKMGDRFAPATKRPDPKKIAASVPEAILLNDLKKDLPGLWDGRVKMWPAAGEWRVYVLGPVLAAQPNDPESWRAGEAKKWEREGAEFRVLIPFAAFTSPK